MAIMMIPMMLMIPTMMITVVIVTIITEWCTYQDERMNHPNFLSFILVSPATRMNTRMKWKNSREKRESF